MKYCGEKCRLIIKKLLCRTFEKFRFLQNEPVEKEKLLILKVISGQFLRSEGSMKTKRQAKMLELIQKNNIETQEELSDFLEKEGFQVTQATVSRDIRELKLTKVAMSNGRQKYVALQESGEDLSEKYIRIFRDAFVSMDLAQNILVIKTVSGMAMAVAAAVDAMHLHEMLGCIAGDDTIMCAIRTNEDAVEVMGRLRKMIEERQG